MIAFCGKDGFVESKGPYAYVLLGLCWLHDARAKNLRLSGVVLAEVDAALRKCLSVGDYWNILAHPISEIRKEHGRFCFTGLPILNYGMLDIPRELDVVDDRYNPWYKRMERHALPKNGRNTVNPACSWRESFSNAYLELYACLFSFDGKAMTASGVGFDCLGKIRVRDWKQPFSDIERDLLNNDLPENLRYKDPGFLNLSCEDGLYRYEPIWDGERANPPRRGRRPRRFWFGRRRLHSKR